MDINQLRYFYTIAKYQNFTQAAAELLVAQPALSQSMKNLETELNVPLFIRSGKHITLSPAGVELQRRLRTILPQFESLPAVLQRLAKDNRDTLNISVTVAAAHVVPVILEEFSLKHPELTLRLHSSSQTFCDFHISSDPPDKDFTSRKIAGGQEIFLLVKNDSNLAEKEEVSLLELQKERFILQTANHSIRAMIDSYFALAGFTPTIAIECDFLYLIPQMVEAGYGLALLPRDAVSNDRGVKFLKVTNPVCERDIYLSWHSEAPLTEPMAQFYDFFCRRFPLLPD